MQRSRLEAGFTGLQVTGLVLLAVFVTAGLTWWVLRTYVFPTHFEPVQLSAREELVLDTKLRRIGLEPDAWAVAGRSPARSGGAAPLPGRPPQDVAAPRVGKPAAAPTPGVPLEPEPYREDPESRNVSISEREFNALLANNTDLAERLAIDFSDDLASAKLLIPVDPDFPVWGGRIVRVSAGVELRIADGRPVVILRGISLMGVPLPSAWLGNLKHVDLVQEFGGRGGFWSAFAAGIDHMQVSEGELKLVLKE